MSMFAAVVPVIAMVAPVAVIWLVRSWVRNRWTSASVALLAGADFGTTVRTGVLPASFMTGGATAATSGSFAAIVLIAFTAADGSDACSRSTTTVSGPLKPGPKPLLKMSYA